MESPGYKGWEIWLFLDVTRHDKETWKKVQAI